VLEHRQSVCNLDGNRSCVCMVLYTATVDLAKAEWWVSQRVRRRSQSINKAHYKPQGQLLHHQTCELNRSSPQLRGQPHHNILIKTAVAVAWECGPACLEPVQGVRWHCAMAAAVKVFPSSAKQALCGARYAVRCIDDRAHSDVPVLCLPSTQSGE